MTHWLRPMPDSQWIRYPYSWLSAAAGSSVRRRLVDKEESVHWRQVGSRGQNRRCCASAQHVAVYFTMQDGKLIRFDKNAGSSIKAEDLCDSRIQLCEAQRARRSWMRHAGPEGHRAPQSYRPVIGREAIECGPCAIVSETSSRPIWTPVGRSITP